MAAAPAAEISTFELDRGKEHPDAPSYTVDTLEFLTGKLGDSARLHLLIGADQALDFRRWRSWERILDLATPAVMMRAPPDRAEFRAALEARIGAAEASRWLGWVVPTPNMAINATEIRSRLARGEAVDDLLQPAVVEYIQRHRLYR